MIRYNMRAIVGGPVARDLSLALAIAKSLYPLLKQGRQVRLDLTGIERMSFDFEDAIHLTLLYSDLPPHVLIHCLFERWRPLPIVDAEQRCYIRPANDWVGLSFGVSVDTPNANVGP